MSKKTEDGLRVYELGFILVPTIVPESLEGTFESIIKKPIIDAGAEIITTEVPELMNLAYPMTKKIGAGNKVFVEGYFGWVKFSLSTDKTESLKDFLSKSDQVLRSIFINTVRENTYLGKRASSNLRDEKEFPRADSALESAPLPIVEEESKPLNETEMEKSIEEMTKSA